MSLPCWKPHKHNEADKGSVKRINHLRRFLFFSLAQRCHLPNRPIVPLPKFKSTQKTNEECIFLSFTGFELGELAHWVELGNSQL